MRDYKRADIRMLFIFLMILLSTYFLHSKHVRMSKQILYVGIQVEAIQLQISHPEIFHEWSHDNDAIKYDDVKLIPNKTTKQSLQEKISG